MQRLTRAEKDASSVQVGLVLKLAGKEQAAKQLNQYMQMLEGQFEETTKTFYTTQQNLSHNKRGPSPSYFNGFIYLEVQMDFIYLEDYK